MGNAVLSGQKGKSVRTGNNLLCGTSRYNTPSTGFQPTKVFYWFDGLDGWNHDVHFFMWYDADVSTTEVYYMTDSIVDGSNNHAQTGTRKFLTGTIPLVPGYTFVNSSGVCLAVPPSMITATNYDMGNMGIGINYFISD